jgi:hypothetical protein
MSRENVEIVRHSIEAWNGRDLATWTASLHPDVEIDWSRSRVVNIVENGQITCLRLFQEPDEALEAVGLSK